MHGRVYELVCMSAYAVSMSAYAVGCRSIGVYPNNIKPGVIIYISSLFHSHIHECIIKCNSNKQKVTYIQIMIIIYINHSVHRVVSM